MKTLTKDEVRKLTPEQQEALGTVEAQRIRTRQQLLDRARGYRGLKMIVALLMAVAMGLGIYSVANPRALVFAIIAGIKANNGEEFKYPWSLELIK